MNLRKNNNNVKKKPDTKDYMLHNFIYIKFLEKGKCRRYTHTHTTLQLLRVGLEWQLIAIDMKEFWGDGCVPKLVFVEGFMTVCIY